MKRTLIGIFLLAAVLALSGAAAACGGDPEPIATPVVIQATSTPEPTPIPEPTPTAEPTPVPPTPTPVFEDAPDAGDTGETELSSEATDVILATDPSTLVGEWDGTILAMGLQINFIVSFVMDGDVLTGSVSVPGQGIEEASLGPVNLGQGSISFTDPDSGVTFDGEFDGTQIKGTFQNQGLTFGFTMVRAE